MSALVTQASPRTLRKVQAATLAAGVSTVIASAVLTYALPAMDSAATRAALVEVLTVAITAGSTWAAAYRTRERAPGSSR